VETAWLHVEQNTKTILWVDQTADSLLKGRNLKEYLNMTRWFRSEPMEYISLIVNEDAAHDCLGDLGKMGVIQFTDVSYIRCSVCSLIPNATELYCTVEALCFVDLMNRTRRADPSC
jgi:hypothetical protein